MRTRLLVALAIVALAAPTLGRPVVAEIDLRDYAAEIRQTLPHLKELRPLGTDIRVLFMFGPDRVPVLLYAGDKAGEWTRWYAPAVKEAAATYRRYLKETGLG
jgi:hypothetical protein